MKDQDDTPHLTRVCQKDAVSIDLVKNKSIRTPPPQYVIDKMNRVIIAAAKVDKTPAELEDDIYREMFE